jgi:tetratricopeptide (TPR) repeat protein
MTLAQVLASEGDERAPGVLEQVLAREPKHCMAHIYLGILACKSADRGKAILLAKRAEKLAASALDYLEIGRLYHELQEFQAAADAYLNADRLGYENKGRLYASLAVCYAWLGDKETGRKYLQWAIKRDPEDEYVKSVFENTRSLVGISGTDTTEGRERGE